jgi:AP2 domain
MEIPLSQGMIAHIDEADWPLVAPYKWYAAKSRNGIWYARAHDPKADGTKAKLRMHCVILGLKGVDHRDGNGLNNHRKNLRPCSNAQNQQNTSGRGGSSQYKGVSWNKRKSKWRVMFNCHGKAYFVGYFLNEIEAAIAYDTAVLPLAGDFARLNFPFPAPL